MEDLHRARHIAAWRARLEQGAAPLCIDKHAVISAISRLKNGKNFSDGLTAEILKKLDDENLEVLALSIQTFEKCSLHDRWATITASLIPKIAVPKGPQDFRPIASLVTLRKLIGYIFLHALPKCAFDTLQCGFVAGRDAAQAVYCVKRLAENAREWSEPLFIAQLDMSKAFDKVKHSAILRALRKKGAGEQLTAFIAAMLQQSTITLSLGSAATRSISLDRGVPQGAPESPQLFITVTDVALGELLEKWRRNGWGYTMGGAWVPIVAYADDILILAQSEEQLQEMLSDVTVAFEKVGLSINIGKTHFSSTMDNKDATVKLGSVVVRWSKDFEFLGSMITLAGNDESAIKHRMMKATKTYNEWKPILENKRLPFEARMNAYKVSVLSSLAWCSQTWTPTEKHFDKM